MKNLKPPFSLFLCLFFLFTSTTSQAITTTTSGNKKETKISAKQQAKMERLKKKLSTRTAKIKQKRTEREEIEQQANAAHKLGRLAVLFSLGQILLLATPLIFVVPFVAIASIALTVTSFVFSRNALKKIKRSKNPGQYQKSKERAKKGRKNSIGVCVVFALIIAAIVGLYFLPV